MSSDPKKHFPESNTSNSNKSQNGNIELKEVTSVIYRYKKSIIITVFLFILFSGIMDKLLPHKWSSTSVIVTPKELELQPLNNILSELNVLDIEHGITSSYLLSLFMNNFDSKEIRKDYLIHTGYFKKLTFDNKIESNSLKDRKVIEDIIDNNIISYSSSKDKLSEKKEYNYYQLKYTASTPENAHDLLQGYINYVKKITNDDLRRKIAQLVDIRKSIAVQAYDIELKKLNNKQEVIKERLKHSISIAKAAGIQKPLLANNSIINDDPDFSISLGADAMMRKLQIAESLTDVTSLSTDLLNRRIIIEKLENLNPNGIDIQPFEYFQKPKIPTMKEGPKLLFIILLAAFSGFILSSSFVLVRYYIIKSKP